MNKDEVKFIDRLYKDLYLSDEVQHHSSSKDKYKNIKEYIEFLESIHNKVVEHNHIDTLKKMYYDKYVIKEEDIPGSYYKHEQEIALERGFGHIEIGPREKEELNNVIINDQMKSLNNWLDYFLSEDSSYIPFWAKYWAFQGMLKLGNFNKETGKYTKRTKHTVSKFADLNREALALSIDTLLKYLNKETINDNELEQLVKTGSFQSIYTYITNKILSDNSNIIKRNIGKWIKYDQGSDHMPLVNSLQGYNTGWCTAGESTAKSQLQDGDFYVYYTLDENDEYKVPRIAIRMEGNSIGEIRGIADQQNLEPEMEEVVKEKIKDFPDKDKYYKKVNDMKMLTRIYKKYQNSENFSKEDIRFLYEIDSKIEGFGYNKDPRIQEILEYRNAKKDIAYVLDIKETQIATNDSELNAGTVVYIGYLRKSEVKDIYLPNLKIVMGSVHFESLESAQGLANLQYVKEGAFFNSLKSAKGLENLQYIGSYTYFSSLLSSKGLKKLRYVGETIFFHSLESAEDLENLQYVGGSIYFDWLENIDGFVFPQGVGMKLHLPNISILDPKIIPEPLTYEIWLANEVITPENVEKYKTLHKKL